ncbi:MAG: GspE/PulE family protein [Fimbriimonas sp.]
MARKYRIGELLLRRRLITEEQLEAALQSQRTTPLPLGAILMRQGYVTEDDLLNAIAAHANVRPWRIELVPPTPEAIEKLPAAVCHANRILPVAVRGDTLVLATADPDDIEAIDLARYQTRMQIEPVLVDRERLLKAIDAAHGRATVVEDLVDQALKDFQFEVKKDREQSTLTEADTRPVVGLVNQILVDAIRLVASDIHIEPRQDRIEVRYRIDGQLRKVREIPPDLLPMLTTRIKIMAELDIVESRLPQDGRIAATIDNRSVDLRISVLPSHHGQRIVLRILDKAHSVKKLEDSGFTPRNLDLFRSLVGKPYGLFLVTGPTGSGKTTTLYSAINEMKSEASNVMTCEDPIEYELDGVNQSQVNEKVGLTFARQLRAILRQDPDVVLVGEIRDAETAETAVRASITGHMVLSTLHCNDAPSAIPRLLDMGIEPFMLSTALVGTMSQRLVRLLCPGCRQLRRTTPAEVELFRAYGQDFITETWEPKGCVACGGLGFRGRRAIHEIMPVTPPVARLIAAHEPLDAVVQTASAHGYSPMQHQALDMVLKGVTSLEEARRVVFFDASHGLSGLTRSAA